MVCEIKHRLLYSLGVCIRIILALSKRIVIKIAHRNFTKRINRLLNLLNCGIDFFCLFLPCKLHLCHCIFSGRPRRVGNYKHSNQNRREKRTDQNRCNKFCPYRFHNPSPPKIIFSVVFKSVPLMYSENHPIPVSAERYPGNFHFPL